MLYMLIRVLPALLFAISASAVSQQDEFPGNPLTLGEALKWTVSSHPSIESSQLEVSRSATAHEFNTSVSTPAVDVLIVPQRVDRVAPDAPDSLDDSTASLRVVQPLYDFGRKKAASEVTLAELDAASLEHERNVRMAALETLDKFFAVLLADLNYSVRDEKMTLSFLRFNRMVEENSIYETHAEVDLLEKESIYRDLFYQREEARIDRITTRRALALAMGMGSHVEYTPRDLASPDVSVFNDRQVPEFEELLEAVLKDSVELKLARLNMKRQESELERIDKNFMPKLDAFIEGTEWRQETGSRNAAMIGLRLQVPLFADEQKRRDRKIGQIDIDRSRLKMNELEYQLRQRVFEIWKTLRVLQTRLAAARIKSDYRDQYMDRSRTLYELEEVSDLGDAQAEQVRALLELRQVEFQIVLTWAQINVMTGKDVLEF